MLGKLLKYDFKSFMRILLPVYAGIIALSGIVGIMLRFGETKFLNASLESEHYGTAFVIIFMLFVFAIMGCGLITLIILIQSYYKNLLGEQGYLMFALPVKTRALVTSKILSAGLLTFVSGIVGILSFGVIMLLQIGTNQIQIPVSELSQLWDMILAKHDLVGEIVLPIILGVLSIIASCLVNVAHIYASISIGHLWNNHRIAGSILAYVGITVIEGIIISIFGDLTIMEVFMKSVNTYFGFSIIINLISAVLFWFISWIILDKKLNLA